MLEQYIDQMCDAYTDAISISNRQGIIVLVNKKHAEYTGIPRREMLGKSVQSLVRDGVFDVVLNPQIIEEKKSTSAIQKVKNGRQLVLNGHPIFDEKGDVSYVITFIRDITALSSLKEEITRQRELLATFQSLGKEEAAPVVVNSPAMKKLFMQVKAIANTDATILLLGETGVGKDVISRTIHQKSLRAEKVFIKVDCGSIPENLIETELFGYIGGTFSGANKQGKVGLIEAASGGTLFLDEIGELPLHVQSRLLRFLQDKEVMRVGATTPKKVDARIVAATNRDLQQAVKKGTFRSDLYYRLKVAVLEIPPLRKRREDIIPMARTFLDYYNNKYEKKTALSQENEALLRNYSWPGNVRELENMMQRSVLMGTANGIDSSFFSFNAPVSASSDDGHIEFNPIDIEGKSYKEIMRELESVVIMAGMKRYGTIAETAKHFQLDRSTVFRKVKEYE